MIYGEMEKWIDQINIMLNVWIYCGYQYIIEETQNAHSL